MNTVKTYNHFNITTIIGIVVILFISISCSKFEEEKIEAIVDRSALPKLRASDITTIISDSGITRFRISTPQWDMYDKAAQPYWEFTMGIHFERFDENLKVDANIQSDYAKFLSNEQLWELKGNVKMTNIKGELFETEQLFWDRRQGQLYSDSIIRITKETGVFVGEGFVSNEQMTKYTILKTTAIIPVEDK